MIILIQGRYVTDCLKQMASMKVPMEGKMSQYMVIWIRVSDGAIDRVTDETAPTGDVARTASINLKTPLQTHLTDTMAIQTFGTQDSPGCRYVYQGGRYRWVCE